MTRSRWLGLAMALLALPAVPARTAGTDASDTGGSGDTDGSGGEAKAAEPAPADAPDGETNAGPAKATFAGGCFWCMEPPYEKLEGVLEVTSGYTGGTVANPSYKQVSSGGTGHTEAVRIVFDPRRVSYDELLEIFWYNIDPTVDDRQFCDVGSQYRAAIFYHSPAQKKAAEASRNTAEQRLQTDDEIVTTIESAGAFYAAESYHQDYYKEHPLRYKFYRANCGRDRRLRKLWGEHAGGH